MGDRVQIIFTGTGEPHENDPMVYLHWGGYSALDLLAKYWPGMRGSDVPYSAARFVGQYCAENEGNCGIGIWGASVAPGSTIKEQVGSNSHGDAGVVVVDCTTRRYWCVAGYLEDEHPEGVISLPESVTSFGPRSRTEEIEQ